MASPQAEPIVPSPAASVNAPATRGVARRAAVGTFVTLSVIHLMVDMAGSVWPIFKSKEFANLDIDKAGVIASVTAITAMAMQPMFGYLADHGRQRLFVLLGGALTFCTLLLGPVYLSRERFSDAGLYVFLFCMLMTARVGIAMYHPAGASVAGNSAAGRRSMLLALFIAAGMLGQASSWLAFSWLWDWTEGRTHWALLPMLGVLVLVAVWCRPVHDHARARVSPLKALASLRHVWTPLIQLYFLLALMAALNFGLFYLLPEFVAARGYPKWMEKGGAFFLIVAGSAAVMVPMGHLADRMGHKRVLSGSLVVACVCYFALVLAPPMHVAAFAVLCFCSGAMIGTINPLGVSFGQHLAKGRESFISGILMGLAWALGSVSPALLGYFVKDGGTTIPQALACLGGVSVVAVVLSTMLPSVDRVEQLNGQADQ